MAFQISPGVLVQEKDLSNVVPAVATTIGGIVGDFQWGPVHEITSIDSENNLVERFGKPTTSVYYDFMTTASFLAYGSNALVVREVDTDTAVNAVSETRGGVLTIDNVGAADSDRTEGTYTIGASDYSVSPSGGTGATFSIVVASGGAATITVTAAGSGYSVDDTFTVTDSNLGGGGAASLTFDVASISKGFLIKNDDDYDSKTSSDLSQVGPWVAKYPGSLGNSLKVSIADKYAATNTSIASIALDSADTATDRTTATVTIGAPDLAIASGGVQATATATLAGGAVTAITVTNPGFGYATVPTVTVTVDGTGSVAATATRSTKWTYTDDFDSIPGTSEWASDNGATDDELNIIVIDEDGEISGTAGTILEKFAGVSKASDAKDDVNQTNYYANVINQRSKWIWWTEHLTTGTNWGTSSAGGTDYAKMDTEDAQQTISLVNGLDDSPDTGDLQSGYGLFANDELVDVSLIMNSAHSATVGDYIIDNVCDVRKDCLVFLSPQRASAVLNEGSEATDITGTTELGAYTRSSFAVMDSGWKYMYDKYNDRYVYVPLNGDVAGTCVVTDNTDDPWFSPAGFNRGVIKNAVKLAWSPKKADRDTLYKNGVNPVINSPGAGIVLFGDKTLLAKPSAFNRINVRRLFIVLEKAIATAAKFQLFEFNDAFTRAQFVALVEPFLRDVQGRRGIYDFRVVCDETNNTPQVIDSNEFRADIFVKPAKSINFITLTFIATRTGISFEELGA